MAEPYEPPPTPGTDSFDDSGLAPPHPRYREESGLAWRARTGGYVPITEGARVARTDAVAVDVSAAVNRGVDLDGTEPPIARELIGSMRANLAATIDGAPGRAHAIAELNKAQFREAAAQEAARQAAERAAALTPDRLPEPPDEEDPGAPLPGDPVAHDAPEEADRDDGSPPTAEDTTPREAAATSGGPGTDDASAGVPEGDRSDAGPGAADPVGGSNGNEPDATAAGRPRRHRHRDRPERPRAADATPVDETPVLMRDPDYPLAGLQLTQPWLPLAAGTLLVPFEAMLGSRAIQPIIALGGVAATFAAATFVLVLTGAADGTGRIVAPLLMRMRRRLAVAVLAFAAAGLISCVVWAVVSFGLARQTNIAYQDARSGAARTASHGLSFPAVATKQAATQALRQPIAAPKAPGGPSRPDARFAVPVTLAALLLTFVLSIRCNLAEPWRAREASELQEAEDDRLRGDARRQREDEDRRREQARRDRAEAARQRMRAARQQIADAARSSLGAVTDAQQSRADCAALLDANDLVLLAAARRELDFTASMFARFETEVGRVCGINGLRAPRFVMPALPEAEAVLVDLLERPGPVESHASPVAPADPPPGAQRATAAGTDTPEGEPTSPPPPPPPRSQPTDDTTPREGGPARPAATEETPSPHRSSRMPAADRDSEAPRRNSAPPTSDGTPPRPTGGPGVAPPSPPFPPGPAGQDSAARTPAGWSTLRSPNGAP